MLQEGPLGAMSGPRTSTGARKHKREDAKAKTDRKDGGERRASVYRGG